MNEKFWAHKEIAEGDQEEIEDGLFDYESMKNEIATELEQNNSINYIETSGYLETYGQDAVKQVYEWYSAAIGRRNRQPLEEGRFIGHFFEGNSTDKPLCTAAKILAIIWA